MVKCKICGREFASLKSLSNHLRYRHQDYTPKRYYDVFLKKDGEGICEECGEDTRFYSVTGGYASFCCKQCANRNHDKNIKARQTFIENHQEIYRRREEQEVVRQKHKKDAELKKEQKIKAEIEKYGQLGLSPREKIEATCLKRYGVKCYVQSEEFKQKAKQTSITKYGVEHPMQSEEVRENLKRSVLETYGVESSSQNEEIIRRTNETKQRKNLEFQQLGYTQAKTLLRYMAMGGVKRRLCRL